MSSTMTRPRSNVRDALGPLHRRRQQRRRRVRLVLIGLLVSALVGGGAWLIGWSSALTARHIAVQGLEQLNRDEVVQAAQVPMGTPLARVDITAVSKRVATLRPVAEVTVTRSWPSTITVKVTERRPVFVLRHAGQNSLVDASGIVYAPVDKPGKDMIIATAGSTDVDLLTDMATVINELPPALRSRTEEVHAESRDTIRLALTKNDTVEWGSADESRLKGEVAVALLKHKGSVYNVTVPAHPTIR